MLGASQFDRATATYGLAHFGKSLFWFISEILFAFYLSEICHVPAAYMGIILAVGLLCGATADACVGRWFTFNLSNANGAGRLQLTGAFASAITIVLFFATSIVPETLRVFYATALSICFRGCYALYDLPQNALMSIATVSDTARSTVATTRAFFSGLASFIVCLSTGYLLSEDGDSSATQRFISIAFGVSLIAVLSAFILQRQLRNIPGAGIQSPEKVPPMSNTRSSNFPSAIWIIVGMCLATAMSGSVFNKLEPYYAAYVIDTPFWGGITLAGLAAGQTVSQPVWGYVSRRVSRQQHICFCAGMIIVSAGLFWLFAGLPTVVLPCAVLLGAAFGGMGMVQWATFADQVAKLPAYQTGRAFGVLTAAIKGGLAVTVLSVGLGLRAFDYRGTQSGGVVALMCLSVITGASIVLALVHLLSLRRL